MTGSAVKRSGTKWTVSFSLPFKQGGWFGRGVIPRLEPTEGGRIVERGSKRCSFFASIFASILGWIWGHILEKIKIFNVFGIHFLVMTFHVIMSVLGPVCVPLDVPK